MYIKILIPGLHLEVIIGKATNLATVHEHGFKKRLPAKTSLKKVDHM